jgi:hypothetical protein
MIYLVEIFIICSEFSAESMQGYDTSLIYLNWIQVYQLAIDTILFYDNKIILLLLTYLLIDLFILKNMGVAIIDFRVCPPLVKCQNIMFSGFIDTLMYGFSSTGVTIYYQVGFILILYGENNGNLKKLIIHTR